MTRVFYLLFGLFAYLVFFATFLYLIGFVGSFPQLPRTVDRGAESGMIAAFVVNFTLVAIFGLQHSIMARQSFKRGWTRIVPVPI